VNLPNAVEGNTARLAGLVHDLKNPTLALRETDLLEGDPVDRAISTVEIPDLEVRPAKLPVVPDARQQFMDRCHGGYSRSGNCARVSRNLIERAWPGTRTMNPRFSRVMII
jgi:hypothetical protein